MNTQQEINTHSREYVQTVLLTRERVQKIIATADRSGCLGVVLAENFTVVPVHYMQAPPETGWELGFVPTKVDYNGFKISSNDVFFYSTEEDRIRGPNECVFSNGEWERYPD